MTVERTLSPPRWLFERDHRPVGFPAVGGFHVKVNLGLLELAGLFLLLAAVTTVLAQSSPEASYTPIVPVTVILVAFALVTAGRLLFLAVKE